MSITIARFLKKKALGSLKYSWSCRLVYFLFKIIWGCLEKQAANNCWFKSQLLNFQNRARAVHRKLHDPYNTLYDECMTEEERGIKIQLFRMMSFAKSTKVLIQYITRMSDFVLIIAGRKVHKNKLLVRVAFCQLSLSKQSNKTQILHIVVLYFCFSNVDNI